METEATNVPKEGSSTTLIQESKITQLRTEQNLAKSNFSVLEEKILEAATTFFGKMNNSIDAAKAIMGDIEQIVNSTCDYLVAECKLASLHLDRENQNMIVSSLTYASSNVKETLKKMNTEYKINSTLMKKGLLQMPVKRTFNEVNVQIGSSFQTVKSEATILPIKFQITKFLELPNVLQTILDYQEEVSTSNKYSNFINGESWKKIKEKWGNEYVIPIFLYNDDFAPDDSLSPHGSSNKLSAFYYR